MSSDTKKYSKIKTEKVTTFDLVQSIYTERFVAGEFGERTQNG